jgi:signal peptidase I
MSNMKKITAGVVSAVLPGAGQFMLRNRQAGAAWLIAFLAFLFLSSFARLWAHYYGLVASVWVVLIAATVSAYKTTFKFKSEPAPSRWWVLLFVLFAWIPAQITQIAWRVNGFRLFVVPSTSMEPTIRRGDRVVADLHFFRNHAINRGDIVIYNRENTFLVKRVEAIPGDVIEGRQGDIFLNGREVDEGFEKPDDPANSFLANFGPVRIPPGEYFVMGDNRPLSLDSRAPRHGPIKENEISGRALFVYDPFNHSHDKRLITE